MTDRERRPLNGLSARIRAGLALGVVGLLCVTGTYAYWTDTVPVSGTTISAGTLDLKVNGQDSLPSYTDLSLTSMVPGESTAAVLTVKNSGTVDLTYYATSTASSDLGSALSVKVTADSSTGGTARVKTCPGTALTTSGSSFGGNLVGTESNPRKLSSGSTETLCVQASLPASAPSSLQGATSNVTLTFKASQVTS